MFESVKVDDAGRDGYVRFMPAFTTPSQLPDFDRLSRKELVALVLEQREQIAQLRELVLALRVEIDLLKRGGRRQATPFSKGTRKADPKKPGRKPLSRSSGFENSGSQGDGSGGSENFSFRKAPPAAAITEPEVDVPLNESSCPACGGNLGPVREEMAYITDLPEVIVPKVTAYRVQVCLCSECGKSVRAKHPDLAQDQWGASAHRLGPRVMAAAHLLHMVAGVTIRKVPAVLKELAGITLTQGAITRDMLKRCEPEGFYAHGEVAPAGMLLQAYQRLRAEIRQESYIHTDDTGWKINGSTAFLMTFESKNITLFQIRYRHRNEEVREVIPSDYPGTMVTDRGTSYDAKEFDNVKQNKCASHVIRSIDEVLNQYPQSKIPYSGAQSPGAQAVELICLPRLKALLQEAVVLWWQRRSGAISDYEKKARALQEEATHLLQSPHLAHRVEQSLLKQLRWHHGRENLLRFLTDPDVEPTNNRAERALRPAVIARKISQCSKTTAGADAYAVFASVLCTLKKRTYLPLIDVLCEVFQTGRVQCASP